MEEKLNELLTQLEDIHQHSDILRFCLKNDSKWGYYLIQSPLEECQPIIIGFNWGVDRKWAGKGNEYKSQKKIEGDVIVKYKGFVKNTIKSCEKHFPNIDLTKGSHSNFCFFRSETENQITNDDIEKCIPVFEKMIGIVNPSIIFCFSSKARDYLRKGGLIKNKVEDKISSKTKSGRNVSFIVVKGKFSNGADIYCLPHPNSKMPREIRERAWNFCTSSTIGVSKDSPLRESLGS